MTVTTSYTVLATGYTQVSSGSVSSSVMIVGVGGIEFEYLVASSLPPPGTSGTVIGPQQNFQWQSPVLGSTNNVYVRAPAAAYSTVLVTAAAAVVTALAVSVAGISTTQGVVATTQANALGGSPPYTNYQMGGTALPAGWAFDNLAGVLTVPASAAAGTTSGLTISVTDSAGTTVVSSAFSVAVAAAPTIPAAPAITVAAGAAQATVGWTDGSNGGATITSHHVYGSSGSGQEDLLASGVLGSSWVDGGLRNGNRFYQVAAVNPVGRGPRSAEVHVVITPVTAQAPYVSGGVRARLTAPYGGSTSTNNIHITRLRDKSNVSGTTMSIEVWNGGVYTGAGPTGNSFSGGVVPAGTNPEIAGYIASTNRIAILTNLSGVGLNQSSATLTTTTWVNAYAGATGYVWKLDGTTPSSGDIAAAITAGTLALTDSNRCLLLPPGWRARTDDAAVTITAGTPYMLQMESGIQSGGAYFLQTILGLRPDLGDAHKADITANAGTLVFNSNWTTASASQSVASGIYLPVAVHIAPAAPGVKSVAITGDSIAYGYTDTLYPSQSTFNTGDADGAFGYLARALNVGGYAFYNSSVPGDSASNQWLSINGSTNPGLGDAHRALQHRYCSAAYAEMGPNDRAANKAGATTTWTGAAPAGYQSLYRWYWARMRTQLLAGSAETIVALTIPPHTSSTAQTALTSLTYDGNVTATLVVPTTYAPGLKAGQQFRLIGATGVWSTTNTANAGAGVWTVATASVSGGSITATFTTPAGMPTIAAAGSIADYGATTAGQTRTGEGIQYTNINPFLTGGSFNVSLGDPDAAYDVYTTLQTLAPANGFTDVLAYTWPSNGLCYFSSFEGTHIPALQGAYIAADLATHQATLLGF